MSNKTVERLQVVVEATSKPLKDEMKKIRASIKEATKGMDEQKAAMQKSMNAQMAPIRKAREQMNRFSESIKNACRVETPTGQFKNMEKEIATTEKQLQKLIEKRERLERSGKNIEMTQEYKEVQKAVSDAEKQLDHLEERQERMRATGVKESSQSWKNLEYDIEQARNSVRAAKIDLENMPEADKFQNTEEWKELNHEISKVKTNLAQCHAKQEEFEKSAKVSRISREYGRLKGTLKDTNSAIKKGSGLFAALIQKFKTGIPWLNRTKSSMRGLGSEGRGLGGIFRTLGMTARFMFTSFLLQGVIGQVKEGFKNLAKYSNEYATQFNSSITLMYSSLKQLQNALATAFEPIVNVVAPYITTLIQHLTAGANALAQFFSALTGSKNWTKATYNTQNYAESLDKASDSAKKLKNELYGFDEITKQSDTDSSSGSGVAAGDMFTEETVNNQFADFAQMVKDAWENADFTEVGTTIANKLKTALGKIDWESVYSVAGNFGTGLATFLNGLFSADKKGNTVLGSLGTTIAGALNTVIYAVFSFSEEFEWADFGSALKDGIQKFINTADFATAGYTVGNLVKGIATSVYIAVSDVNTWKSLGTKIGEGINGFFNSMGTKDKKTGLTGWETLGKTISDTISGIAKSMTTALKSVRWKDVGQAIADFICAVEWEDLIWDFANLADAIGKGVVDALLGVSIEINENTVLKWLGIDTKDSVYKDAVEEFKKEWDGFWDEWSPLAVIKKAFKTPVNFDALNSIKDFGKKIALTVLAGMEELFGETKLWEWIFGDKSYKEELAELTASEKKTGTNKTSSSDKKRTSGGFSITGEIKFDRKKTQANANNTVTYVNKKGKTKSVTTKVINNADEDANTIYSKTSISLAKLPGLKTTVENTTKASTIRNPLAIYFERFGLKTTVKNTTSAKSLHDPLSGYFMKNNLKIGVSNTTKASTIRNPLAAYMKNKPLKTTVQNTTSGSSIRKPLATYMKANSLKTGVESTVSGTDIYNYVQGGFGAQSLYTTATTTSGSDLFAMVESDWNVSAKTLKLSAEITADSIVVKGEAISEAKAGGGLLKNGSWRPITAFAGGGLPGTGQMFVAREAGPELVGTIGGHTAVMNNNQIVSSVAAGVANAVAGVMSQFSGNSSQELHVYVGGKEITDYVIKDVNQRTIATGACPIMT